MKLIATTTRPALERLVGEFLDEMHRYDAGRTLPILHAARLTTPQLAVLEFAGRPRTVSAIAAHIGLSRPATSQLIQKLFERQLVRRSEGLADRRERTVALTARGASLLESIAAARAARFHASLAALPAVTAGRLEDALAATVEAFRRNASPLDSGEAQ